MLRLGQFDHFAAVDFTSYCTCLALEPNEIGATPIDRLKCGPKMEADK